MNRKGRRKTGLVTCKFSEDVDLSEANKFIQNWIGYAVTVVNNYLSRRLKIIDRDIVQSSALEACLQTFYCLKKNSPLNHLALAG